MPWTEPEDYKPRADLVTYLRHVTPQGGTGLFKMVDYVQKRSWPDNMSPDDALKSTHITPALAREAIDQRIVPMEIYKAVLAIALKENH